MSLNLRAAILAVAVSLAAVPAVAVPMVGGSAMYPNRNCPGLSAGSSHP